MCSHAALHATGVVVSKRVLRALMLAAGMCLGAAGRPPSCTLECSVLIYLPQHGPNSVLGFRAGRRGTLTRAHHRATLPSLRLGPVHEPHDVAQHQVADQPAISSSSSSSSSMVPVVQRQQRRATASPPPAALRTAARNKTNTSHSEREREREREWGESSANGEQSCCRPATAVKLLWLAVNPALDGGKMAI